jgi:predicted GNAT family acetyltransferase
VKEPKRGTTCGRKGCGKKLTIPEATYATDEDYAVDPFCSADCCRKFYGIVTKTLAGHDEDKRKDNKSKGGYVKSHIAGGIGRGRKGVGRV